MIERLYKSCNLTPSHYSTYRSLRVADILLAPEDDCGDCIRQPSMEGVGDTQQQRHGCAANYSYSPCRIVARLMAMLRRAKKQGVSQPRQKILKPGEVESSALFVSRSGNGLNGNEESGQHRNDASFKLGVTCGLLYMIAASKNEYSKILELRKEMEMLLQHVKQELPRKEAFLKPLKQSDILACSVTDIHDVSSSNSHILVQSQPVLERNMGHNNFLEYNLSEKDEYVEGIRELEAELEVELERLQELYLDEETAFEDTQQERVKVTVMDSSTKSHSSNSGEIIDPQEASDVSFGVSPIELERRLHELLEARLQEQITDLECALEYARQKVNEKETEVTWWKDTAGLISQHVPETSRFTFRLDPKAASMLKGEH